MHSEGRRHAGLGADGDDGRVEAFVRDLYEVCDRHGMTLEPGDVHAGTTIIRHAAGEVIDALRYADAREVLGTMPKSAFDPSSMAIQQVREDGAIVKRKLRRA